MPAEPHAGQTWIKSPFPRHDHRQLAGFLLLKMKPGFSPTWLLQASPAFVDAPGISAASFMMLADASAPPHPRVTIVFSSPCCLSVSCTMQTGLLATAEGQLACISTPAMQRLPHAHCLATAIADTAEEGLVLPHKPLEPSCSSASHETHK